ncbi:hypothetical protein [Flavobacterium sp.]|uniref:hypothetical protein n=1 Tax=Flavobacterium sp. TaxID=239 RepID=UPI0011FDD957|nr:hypothetical protein [Flavobacterium sp.]RZJ71560.1 MAG: hypothetical protein EOO49_09380 [Flavobacterium sp.]
MESENNLVWYAVYGSNLSSGRFIHYIQGGNSSGSTKACEPCNDTSLPQKEQLFELQHELVFARSSTQWQNGGVAFIDREPSAQTKTLAKLYLITKEQFNHVARWETGGNPIEEINIDEAISEGSTVFKHPSWYGMVLYLGQVDDIPVLTLTDEAIIKVYTKPSPQYLTQIVNGLRDTYNFSSDQTYQYLKSKRGIIGNYKDYELYDVAAGLLNPKRDFTQKLFSDYAREYDGMQEGEEKEKMKLAMNKLMLKYYGGFSFDYLK